MNGAWTLGLDPHCHVHKDPRDGLFSGGGGGRKRRDRLWGMVGCQGRSLTLQVLPSMTL